MPDGRVDWRALPPADAIAYFRAKGYALGFDWRDVWAEEHAVAFTAAKATSLDVLIALREAVDRALAEGQAFDAFARDLRPLLARLGWWGRKEMVDPLTGEVREAQLGSDRRLDLIFRVNLRVAYAAGQWRRIERVADRRPWLRYVSIRDARTRPEHAAWHGTILRHDHPWWGTHYPPNGWNCRCRVQQLSEDDLTVYGLRPSVPPAGGTYEWLNRRTGERVQVPDGIDPGWGHNVGMIDRAAEAMDRLREARQWVERG